MTAVGAEPDEEVAAGAMLARMARDNGRDAVIDVPERLIQLADPTAQVQVALVSDGSAAAIGRVRDVAPETDAVTRTFRLGSAVTGGLDLADLPTTPLPASAVITK